MHLLGLRIACSASYRASSLCIILNLNGTSLYILHASSDDAFINAIDPKCSGALPALFLFHRAGMKIQSFIGETDIKQLEKIINKSFAS